MRLDFVGPGDMPTAKTVRDRDGVAGEGTAVALEAAAARAGDDGFDRDAGDFVGILVGVALHALPGSLGDGPTTLARDIKDVKNPAEFGIYRDDLDAAALDVAEVKIVIEIDRPGGARGNETKLEACRRVDHHLGGGGDLEGFEEAHQIGFFVSGFVEVEAALLQVILQQGKRVVERTVPVIMLGSLKLSEAEIFFLIRDEASSGDEE